VSGLLALLWNSAHQRRLAEAAVALGAALLVGAGLLGWTGAGLREATLTLSIEQQGLAEADVLAQELAALRADFDSREARTRVLLASGFTGPADRVGWAEAVNAGADRLRPLGFVAAIGTPEWLPLPDEVGNWYAARSLEPRSLQATDLSLKVQGLHEDELAQLLQVALDAGGGVTRLEHCELRRRPDDIGVDADCTLRRFGIGVPDADGGFTAPALPRPAMPTATPLPRATTTAPVTATRARLFFTPAERARITADRRILHAGGLLQADRTAPVMAGATGDAAANGATGETASAVRVPAPRIEGLSTTRDGRAFAWIGGRRYEDGALYLGRRLRISRDGVRFADADGQGLLRRVGDPVSGPVAPRVTAR
jgi:hypothetical protein